MKNCSKCKKEKPLDQFYRNGKARDGRASQCKPCTDDTVREYTKTHRKEVAARALKRYHRDPEKQRRKSRKYFYGLEPEDFEQLRLNQQNCCAICHKEFLKTPQVDHDHATGKIRGLLCPGCNSGIERFKDSPDRLIAAAAYLKKTS